MLYCPKCQKTYEDGSQRFCTVEGERLLPAGSENSAKPTGGVFTNVLRRKNGAAEDKFSTAPKFSQPGSSVFSSPSFRPHTESSMFKAEEDFSLDLNSDRVESKSIFAESLVPEIESREIEPSEVEPQELVLPEAEPDEPAIVEIKDETPAITESEPEPASTETVLAPEDLSGQKLENRFRIIKKIASDESGTEFLAEDENLLDKKVVVKVLNKTDDAFAEQVFADERKELLIINHPNRVNVLDMGELPDGTPYLVTEYFQGETIKDYQEKHGQFDSLSAARIVRQAADALGEAHQTNVLHRNLKPENLLLTVDENGLERVKLTNFGAAAEKLNETNLHYKSPEQIEGKIANSASDIYSLAVIAYQMLTNRLPFDGDSVGEMLKSQREGVRLRPSDVRFDLPPLVDEILEKALAFNSFDRYLKARDFGDEFFSEIIANAPLEDEEETEDYPVLESAVTTDEAESASLTTEEPTPQQFAPQEQEPAPKESPRKVMPTVAVANALDYLPAVRETKAPKIIKATDDLAWEKRSPQPLDKAHPRRDLFMTLGVGALVIALLGVWYYFINRPNQPPTPPVVETVKQNPPTETIAAPPTPLASETNANVAAPTPEEIEAPPLPRSISQPPDTVFFENSRENLAGDAVKNFLGFSLYYPKDWTQSKSANNFLDVSEKAPNGLPAEQLLVSYYASTGTYKLDEANFPEQVKETNATLKKILPNYQMLSEGKKTVNNGWQAYEVQFEGKTKTAQGKDLMIWGKRLFIPTAVRGSRNGYVITMLATSLSNDVQSAEDVGVKGDLATVLATFEPNQDF